MVIFHSFLYVYQRVPSGVDVFDIEEIEGPRE